MRFVGAWLHAPPVSWCLRTHRMIRLVLMPEGVKIKTLFLDGPTEAINDANENYAISGAVLNYVWWSNFT